MIGNLIFGSGIGQPPESIKDLQWWTKEGMDCCHAVSSSLLNLKADQEARRQQYELNERLYGAATSIRGRANGYRLFSELLQNGRATYNLIQSVVDTLNSKMSKNRPRPYYLTSGGNFSQRTQAKRLNKFVEGVFNECNAYVLASDVFRDACILGDGFAHPYKKDDRVSLERVHPLEIWVDELEGLYGNPRTMHRVKAVDRQQLIAMFPDKQKMIEQAEKAVFEGAYKNLTDMVVVRESWHLRSGKDADDGKRCITLTSGTLVDPVEYPYDFFPFARMCWTKPMQGYWGQGLADQLKGTQVEIYKLLYMITQAFDLAASFKVLVAQGSKISKEHINNEIGGIIEWVGDKPEYITPPIVPPEAYGYLNTLIARGYEISGISQLSATGLKPAGLDSGKALREMTFIESDRFHEVSRRYEDLFTQIGKRSLALAKSIAEETGEYKTTSTGVNIDWSEVNLQPTDYDMLCFSTNSLPQEPAGRLQFIQELIEMGYLSQREGNRLLIYPDIEQVESLKIASEENLTRMLDNIVAGKGVEMPDANDDLDLAVQLAYEYIQLGRAREIDGEKLSQLEAFLQQAQKTQKDVAMKAAQDAAAMQMAANPTPPVAPDAPEAPIAPAMPAGPMQ